MADDYPEDMMGSGAVPWDAIGGGGCRHCRSPFPLQPFGPHFECTQCGWVLRVCSRCHENEANPGRGWCERCFRADRMGVKCRHFYALL